VPGSKWHVDQPTAAQRDVYYYCCFQCAPPPTPGECLPLLFSMIVFFCALAASVWTPVGLPPVFFGAKTQPVFLVGMRLGAIFYCGGVCACSAEYFSCCRCGALAAPGPFFTRFMSNIACCWCRSVTKVAAYSVVCRVVAAFVLLCQSFRGGGLFLPLLLCVLHSNARFPPSRT